MPDKADVADLDASAETRARRYVAAAEELAARPAGSVVAPRPVAQIGIVGAGTMGGGIAMCFADAGLPVTIAETGADALQRGLSVIARNYARSAERGRISLEEAEARRALISGTLAMPDLASCDLVIEAVFERFEVKQDVFERLDRICRPGAILATNTSAISVDRIAAVTQRPADVVGMHFFSPAQVMRLLEVVDGAQTAPDVLATMLDLAGRLGKVAVVSGVCHGFIANRMIKLRQAQAQQLLLEGVMPWDIDRVLAGFGFPMGPFAMSDLVGLDLGWVQAESRGESLRDVFCEHGRRGQKVGAGYYDYDDQRRRRPSPEAERLIRDYVASHGTSARRIDDADILDRCILPVINEGARILEEGIARRGSDIDLAWVHGFGWPASRGGPMYYADRRGLDAIVAALAEMHAQNPAIAAASPLLADLAARGGRLSEYVAALRAPATLSRVESADHA